MHLIRRSAAITVASGVAVASLGLLAAPGAAAGKAKAAGTKDPAAAAAGYLSRKLAGAHHDHLVTKVGGKSYPDYGDTADAVLSMDAAGVAQHAAHRATTWLQAHATAYTGARPDVYPGAAAKLLLVATAQHVDPRHFGSLDLLAALEAADGAGGAPAGEYQNPGDTTYGASVLNQSLAVLALANAVSATGQPSTAAVDFLIGQQCADGGFTVDLRADTSKACDATAEDVDATGYAVQALLAAGRHAPAVAALSWVHQQRNTDGGWGEQPGAASDANSTALATEALAAGHRSITKPLAWLAGQQERCGAKPARRGAVRFQGKYRAATDIRATAQAGLALAGSTLARADRNGASSAAPKLACSAHHRAK